MPDLNIRDIPPAELVAQLSADNARFMAIRLLDRIVELEKELETERQKTYRQGLIIDELESQLEEHCSYAREKESALREDADEARREWRRDEREKGMIQ
jgi:hypothetical protein